MATPSDRSALRAALLLWALALIGVALLGLEVNEDSPRRWIGHWITNVWAFTGWIPVLLLARRRPGPPSGGR